MTPEKWNHKPEPLARAMWDYDINNREYIYLMLPDQKTELILRKYGKTWKLERGIKGKHE